jgi:hypothetical protein
VQVRDLAAPELGQAVLAPALAAQVLAAQVLVQAVLALVQAVLVLVPAVRVPVVLVVQVPAVLVQAVPQDQTPRPTYPWLLVQPAHPPRAHVLPDSLLLPAQSLIQISHPPQTWVAENRRQSALAVLSPRLVHGCHFAAAFHRQSKLQARRHRQNAVTEDRDHHQLFSGGLPCRHCHRSLAGRYALTRAPATCVRRWYEGHTAGPQTRCPGPRCKLAHLPHEPIPPRDYQCVFAPG